MGKFLVYQSESGYTFQLKAGNGEIIAVSQKYKSERTCLKGISSVAANALKSPIEDRTTKDAAVVKNPKFEVYSDKADEIRFRLKASNGQIICTSEGYKTREMCMRGIASVKKNAADAKIEKQNKGE